MNAVEARAAIIEAMARAYCAPPFRTDPDRVMPSGKRAWECFQDEMQPLLDAVFDAEAALRTLVLVSTLTRIAGDSA